MHSNREITRNNFDECFPKIKEILESSDFIAFDAEFTGISSSTSDRNSLFDTSRERYLTVKRNIENFIISQFGLTAFKYSPKDNKYLATSFLFYIFPRPIGSLERTFLVESSAFEFLAKHDFDFNKFAQNGISYLSLEMSKTIDSLLKDGKSSHIHQKLYEKETLLKNNPFRIIPKQMSIFDEDLIKAELNRIEEWLAEERQEDDYLECALISDNKDVMDSLVEAIEDKFRTKIIIEFLENNEMMYFYQNVTPEKFQENLKNKYLGFTRLFKLLTEIKKPLIGHNPLLDLMILYHQFNKPLPKTYDIFKKNIHRLFPRLFDTKHISYVLREELPRDKIWDSNELVKLYTYFHSGIGSLIAGFSPEVVLVNKPQLEGSKVNPAHEAGWDSYYTGYCFVRMMHYYAVKANAKCGMGAKPLSAQQHLHCIQMYQNCVNIPRANISHLCFDGPDPPSDKPLWLVVESIKSHRINVQEVIKQLASIVNADVKPLTDYKVLIAVSTQCAIRDIRKKFKGTGYRVQTYSSMKHSAMVRKVLWGGIILTGSVCAIMLWPNLQEAIKSTKIKD